MNSRFFQDKQMPYIESRYDKLAANCYCSHYHDDISISASEEGSTKFTCKDKEYILDIGSLFLINPVEVHFCNPKEKRNKNYHMMLLDPKWCYEIQKDIFEEDIKDFVPFEKTILKSQELYEEFILLNKLLYTNSFYIEKEEKLINFLMKIFATECSIKEVNYDNKEDDKIFEKVKKILDKNINENITLREIEKEVKVNQYKIIRIFKEKIHLTPHAYLMNAKINKAKELMKKGVDIDDVYFLLGFFDQSHFIRNFRKIVATTPKQYQDDILHIKTAKIA